MLRPRRNTQIPLGYRENSPPRIYRDLNRLKRRRIDVEKIDRNDVDQALAVIEAAPECSDELPTLILTELPYFKANYVLNRAGCSRYTGLFESGFFKLFFSDPVIEILFKETNSYVDFQLRTPSLSLYETRRWVPITPAEIRVYLGMNLYFGLYPLAVRDDY
jgi:Transposase IS4